MAIHAERHPTFVEGCDLCRWSSVAVAPSATPTRKGGQAAADVNDKEKRWDRDMGAYKAIRAEGLQPRQIDGAHRLEGANDKMEVELGHIFKTKGELAAAKEGMSAAQEGAA